MAWLTNKETGGKFNTDWITEKDRKRVAADEDKKQKQIAAAKRESEEAKARETFSGTKHMTANEFNAQAKKEGINLTADDIEEYVASSYGGRELGDKISKFIDNAPEQLKVGDEEIYRGLYFETQKEMDDFLRSHRQGQIIESRRDGLSWTTDKNVAREFSSEASDYSVILVNSDDKKNAISIKGIADTPSSSSEVLYSSTTDFEVEYIAKKGGNTLVFVTEAAFSERKYK